MFNTKMKEYEIFLLIEDNNNPDNPLGEMQYMPAGRRHMAVSLRSTEEIEDEDISRASQTWIGIAPRPRYSAIDFPRSAMIVNDYDAFEIRHATDVGGAVVIGLRKTVMT